MLLVIVEAVVVIVVDVDVHLTYPLNPILFV